MASMYCEYSSWSRCFLLRSSRSISTMCYFGLLGHYSHDLLLFYYYLLLFYYYLLLFYYYLLLCYYLLLSFTYLAAV